MAQPKGFATNQGGRKHPVFEKKGITEKQLKTALKFDSDRIIAGTSKPRKFISNQQVEKLLKNLSPEMEEAFSQRARLITSELNDDQLENLAIRSASVSKGYVEKMLSKYDKGNEIASEEMRQEMNYRLKRKIMSELVKGKNGYFFWED